MLVVFEPYANKGVGLFQYYLIFTGINLVILSILGYKFYNMGLLPLNPSDWLDLIPVYKVNSPRP